MEPKQEKILDAQLRGKLVKGLKIVDAVAHEFEMRSPSAGDFIDAEEIVPMGQVASFQLALASRIIVKLGDVKGPIPFETFRELHPTDMRRLIRAVDEAGEAGK